MRLVSYNLLEGLRPQDRTDRRQHARHRLSAAQAVITTLMPDILVLNEASFCVEHDGIRVDYGKLFGFAHQVAALYDGEWGNAILSRLPVCSQGTIPIPRRGSIYIHVETPQGLVGIGSYHPHPNRFPENKALDLLRLAAMLGPSALICGDLNALSPADPIDVGAMVEGFARFSPHPMHDAYRFIESGVEIFELMHDVGYRDAVPLLGRRYTMPTDMQSLVKTAAMRLDHILVTARIAVTHGEVYHSPETNLASDHHPVYIDFTVTA